MAAYRSRVLASQQDDFPRWYQDVLEKAELADNGPVRGTMVIRPYAYALWERMQAELDARIKATGAENVYLRSSFGRKGTPLTPAKRMQRLTPCAFISTFTETSCRTS